MCRFLSIIDILTIASTCLTAFVFTEAVSYSNINNVLDAVNYICYGLHTVRILRVLRLKQYLDGMEDIVMRFIYGLAISVITMLLFGKS